MSDCLEIRRLALTCSVGVYAWEREVTQEVYLDLDIPLDVARAAASDELEDTLDYTQLVDCLNAVAQSGHFNLVETLAERLAEALLEQFSLTGIRLCVDKPAAISSAKSTRICIARSQQ